MFLYLVQHGEAKSKVEDPERPLNETGRANARKSAAFFKQLDVPLSVIWHSGKARAEQTAAILAWSISAEEHLKGRDGLNPTDDVEPVKKELDECQLETVAIVGHLPFLSRLASALLTGDAGIEPIAFKNTGIVCLSRQEPPAPAWKLEWVIPPSLMGIICRNGEG